MISLVLAIYCLLREKSFLINNEIISIAFTRSMQKRKGYKKKVTRYSCKSSLTVEKFIDDLMVQSKISTRHFSSSMTTFKKISIEETDLLCWLLAFKCLALTLTLKKWSGWGKLHLSFVTSNQDTLSIFYLKVFLKSTKRISHLNNIL